MIRKTRFLFLFIFISIISGLIFSSQTVYANTASEPEKVRVGYYENEVFEEGASENAVKNGYAYEYYRKLTEYTGWEYDYVYGSFVEVYDMLLKGEVDVVAGLAYTDDRQGLILYPDKPMGAENYSLVKHESDNNITTMMTTLNGKKIGVLDSAILDALREYLSTNHVEANVIVFNDYEALFSAFDKKEIDLMAAETDGTYGRNHAEILTAFGSSDYYLCVNKDRPDLLSELNDAQKQLYIEEPNYVSLLREKYFAMSLSSRAFTQREKDWLRNNHELRIGYLNNYLPYSNTDKDGNVEGIVTDIVPEILNTLGINSLNVSFIGFDSYDDMTLALTDNNIDVAFPVGGGLFYSEEDGLNLSNPVSSSITNLIYSGKYVSSSNTDFAVNENNRMQYYYIKVHYPEATVSFYSSTEACLNAVSTGNAKCTTLNGLRTNDILRNRAYRNLSFRQLSYSDNRCFGVRIGNEGLLKLFNRGIDIVGQDFATNLAYQYSVKLFHYSVMDGIVDSLWIITIMATIIVILLLILFLRDKAKAAMTISEKEAARSVMEDANNSKTHFLTKLSEDMHNSVEGIVSNVNMAYQHVEEENAVAFLGRVNKSCEHLLWLIDDINDLSNVENGRYLGHNQNVNFRQFINDLKNSSDKNINDTINRYNFKGSRVLIVDRLKDIQVSAAKIMKRVGFEVQIATDGTEAVDIINAAPAGYFDCVLIDIQAPNTEGYEVCRQIRNLDESDKASIPIVAVTADVFRNLNEVSI